MKKFVCFAIAAVILLSGCGSADINGDDDETTAVLEETDPIPEEYKDVISDYKKVVEFRLSKTFEAELETGKFSEINKELSFDVDWESDGEGALEYNWNNMIVDMTSGLKSPTLASFSYVLKDLNGDKIPELIWTNSEGSKIYAVFTIDKGKAMLLDAYWSRYVGVITDSGEIFTRGSGGSSVYEYTVNKLDFEEAGLMKEILCFGRENDSYYKIEDGARTEISKDDFESILAGNPFKFGASWDDVEIYVLDKI